MHLKVYPPINFLVLPLDIPEASQQDVIVCLNWKTWESIPGWAFKYIFGELNPNSSSLLSLDQTHGTLLRILNKWLTGCLLEVLKRNTSLNSSRVYSYVHSFYLWISLWWDSQQIKKKSQRKRIINHFIFVIYLIHMFIFYFEYVNILLIYVISCTFYLFEN